MNKITNFINTIHAIWLTDALTMNEFMDVIEPLMLRHGVNWKENYSYVNEGGELINPILSAEDMFESDVNTKAHDKFHVFSETCKRYMDFTMLGERREAA